MAGFTYQTWIKASPEQIWAALTDPEQNGTYAYGGVTQFDLRPGGKVETRANEGMQQMGMPEVIIDGEVLEVEAPTRIAYTWHSYFDEQLAAEPPTRVTIELAPAHPMMFPDGGVTRRDAHARHGGRAAHGRDRQRRGRRRRRRARVHPQRPEDEARDRNVVPRPLAAGP